MPDKFLTNLDKYWYRMEVATQTNGTTGYLFTKWRGNMCMRIASVIHDGKEFLPLKVYNPIEIDVCGLGEHK